MAQSAQQTGQPPPTAGIPLGPDNQTKAVLAAAWVLGALSGVGLEIRLLLMREYFWTPLLLGAGYLVLILIVYATIDASRGLGVKISIGGKKERVRLRKGNEHVKQRVGSIAIEMGLQATPKVSIIPHTNSYLDGYAAGSSDAPHVVLTGGMSLLSNQKTEESANRFEFLVRHEISHLLRDDPSTFSMIAAIIRTTLFTIIVKGLLFPLVGFERAGAWYANLLPRSFSSSPQTGALSQLPLSGFRVISTILLTNLLLFSTMLVLYWVWVRKREYWADHTAMRSLAEGVNGEALLRGLLSHARLRKFLPHAARGSGFWHPAANARVRGAISRLPRGGFYSATGSLLVVVTIFLFRYVMGNNTGFGTLDYPRTSLVAALSLFYLFLSYVLTHLLVFPLEQLLRDQRYIRYLARRGDGAGDVRP